MAIVCPQKDAAWLALTKALGDESRGYVAFFRNGSKTPDIETARRLLGEAGQGRFTAAAEQINQTLDKLKSGIQPGDLNVMGIIPKAWDMGIDAAKFVIASGGKIAGTIERAIERAIAVIRENNNGQDFNEGEARKKLRDSLGVPHQVVGDQFTVSGVAGPTPSERVAGNIGHARDVFEQAGFKDIQLREYQRQRSDGTMERQQIYWIPKTPGFDYEYEGKRLAELADFWTKKVRTPEERPMGMLIQSISEMFKSPDSALADMTATTRDRLFEIVRSEARQRGQALRELGFFSADIPEVGMNVDVMLKSIYSESYGGENIETFLDGVRRRFGGYFTNEVISGALAEKPELQGIIDKINAERTTGKLIPSAAELVRQIFDTPIYRQDEIRKNFEDKLIKEYGVSPQDASEAAKLFYTVFEKRLAKAFESAYRQSVAALTPQQKRATGMKPNILKKLENLVNSGAMDEGTALREIAKAMGDVVPTDATVAKMRAMSERIMRLRELSEAEKQSALTKAEKVAGRVLTDEEKQQALDDAKADKMSLKSISGPLTEELGREWSKIRFPISMGLTPRTLAQMWNRKANLATAAVELSSLNMLTTFGFAVRLPIHLTTQLAQLSLSSPMARSWHFLMEGNKAGFLRDMARSYVDTLGALRLSARTTLNSVSAELRNAGQGRHLEQSMGGINALDRLYAKANDHWQKGEAFLKAGNAVKASVEHTLALVEHFLALPRITKFFINAVDTFQGTPAEFKRIADLVEMDGRLNGLAREQINLNKETVYKAIKEGYATAVQDAGEFLRNSGVDNPSVQRIREEASRINVTRAYRVLERLGMPADDFKANAQDLRDYMAWKLPVEKGVGLMVAGPARILRKKLTEAGLPVSMFNFAKAIGHSINWTLQYSPLALLDRMGVPATDLYGGIKEGSPFGDFERRERNANAIMGNMVGAAVVGLMAAGVMRFIPLHPMDKRKRDELIAQGHEPGTVEFVHDDGTFRAFSLKVGPFQRISPWIFAAGEIQDFAQHRAEQQAQLNAQAEKLGIEPTKLPDITAEERVMIAGKAVFGSLLASSTARGLVSPITEYGIPDPRRLIATEIGTKVPLLPAYQEVTRMMGVRLDSHLATVTDYLVPLPTSPARAVNVLGDPVETPDAIRRVVSTLTAGSYPLAIRSPENQPYATLFDSGYKAPLISRTQGHNINGVLRPFTPEELSRYTVARGQEFKAALTQLGSLDGMAPEDKKRAVSSAFTEANERALESVGVEAQGRSTGRTARASGAAAAPAVAAVAPRAAAGLGDSRLSPLPGGGSRGSRLGALRGSRGGRTGSRLRVSGLARPKASRVRGFKKMGLKR